jgi:hypothetical protein
VARHPSASKRGPRAKLGVSHTSQPSSRADLILFHMGEYVKELEAEYLSHTDHQSSLIQEIKKKKKRGLFDEARQLELTLERTDAKIKTTRIRLHLLKE